MTNLRGPGSGVRCLCRKKVRLMLAKQTPGRRLFSASQSLAKPYSAASGCSYIAHMFVTGAYSMGAKKSSPSLIEVAGPRQNCYICALTEP